MQTTRLPTATLYLSGKPMHMMVMPVISKEGRGLHLLHFYDNPEFSGLAMHNLQKPHFKVPLPTLKKF